MTRGLIINPLAAPVIFLFLFLTLPGCQSKPDPKKPVATVGDARITYGEFRSVLKDILPEGERDISPQDEAELKKNLLTQMIEERLILKEAEKADIDVTDEEVSDEIKTIKEKMGEEELKAWIKERYPTAENWKEDVRKKLLVKKTVENLVDSKITVTEKEAKDYYVENRAVFEVPEKVRARMIVADTEEKAKEAKMRLKKERFEDVAKKLSVGPEAKDGGDLGFFSRGDLPPEFEDAILRLPPGGTSDIVKTPYGYHIFKAEGKTKGRKLAFKDARKNIIETLFREKSEKKYREWALLLKNDTDIKIDEELLLR